jgi:hypothetical protein
VFRCNKVDIVTSPCLLQLHVPFGKLFGCEVETIPLMSNIVILTKRASQVTTREEDATTAIVPLETRLYALSVFCAYLILAVT